MREERSAEDSDAEMDGRLPIPKRRSVLQGLAALGLGGSAVAAAVAQDNDDAGNGTNGGNSSDNGNGSDGGGGSSGVPVSIQLYTLRDLPDTVPGLIRRVGAVDNNGGPGYDAVEPAGLGEASVEEINGALEQTELSAPSAHIGLEQLEGDAFEDTVQTYTDIGTETFIVPSLRGEIGSVEAVEDVAQRMNDVAANLTEHDLRLGFHNHDNEFQELDDGSYPLELFDENLDDNVVFEIDAGWVLTGGYDPVEIISQYSTRVEFIHMKDMQNGEFYELGEGGLDLEAIARVAREEANVEALVYEHDEPESPAASVATGAGVLSFLDGRPGLECLRFEDVGAPGYSGDLGGAGGDTGNDGGSEAGDDGDDDSGSGGNGKAKMGNGKAKTGNGKAKQA